MKTLPKPKNVHRKCPPNKRPPTSRPPNPNPSPSPARPLQQQARHQPVQLSAREATTAGVSMSINKQHLCARAKTITGKLLDSHGAELRRTLFSLRQMFQDDSELACEFVEADGFECLMKVAVGADQIHQNYILRALGQLIAYSAGMNGLTRHNETIRWLYSLLSSQHRLVVKTSIKLLLLFVEHSDNNCLHFCRAIKSIDHSKGLPVWSNIVDLFKTSGGQQQQQQDVGLLVDAMTLVNKTLAGIPDQDTYYDFVDPLEELGMETLAEKYSKLDSQLKEQFEIYEQALRVEDEEEQDDDESDETGEQQPKRRSKRASARNKKQEERKMDNEQANISNSSGEYVTANEESGEPPTASKQSTCNSPSNSNNVNAGNSNGAGTSSSSGRPHRVDSQPIKQNNLARGKQQRASISSCSSSDSYASYGSGYASGSGNSTDHELKQQQQQKQLQQQQRNTGNINNDDDGTASVSVKVSKTEQKATEANKLRDQNEEEEDDDDDDDDEEGSKLKQHLSELEQLTDELASRNIFGLISQPTNSKHFVQSSSSNSSSIISTGSNLSSALSTTEAATASQQQAQQQIAHSNRLSQQQPLTPSSLADNSSRSASTTPTSTLQVSSKTNSPAASTTSYTTTISPHKTPPVPTNEFPIAKVATRVSQQQFNTAQQLPSPQQAPKQEPYYHNLFQWEQLVSKGVTRPLLINDLDFTDLRDEDDCDLLNSSGGPGSGPGAGGGLPPRGRNHVTGEPLTINIPVANDRSQLVGQDSVDSGTIGSDGGGSGDQQDDSPQVHNTQTPASAPPPMPPPPISPWFNTISGGSRPQSQLMSSPSPPYDVGPNELGGPGQREQSPVNSTYSNYSRNSVCVPQTSTPLRDHASQLMNQYNTLQPVTSLRSASSMSSLLFGTNGGKYANGKRKKTMKLFWKEVREDRSLLSKLTKKRTIWDEIKPVQIDTQKLENLFESKAKDLTLSKSRMGLDGVGQRKVKITVLDAKRSNAINIGMTKLPPMRTIKSAILKMDSSIMNREGIEKILTTMMPTEEEKSRIIEAQLANPNTPLGTAEQFLLNLASISALEARLKLWAFQLDYAQIEKEVAEPFMDLKQAIEEIERSETFRIILGTLLAIGNFLNSTNAKGFQIDYLEKVPEVKDTIHKHSLLHHLCLFIQEKYDPESTSDLYSEFSAVNRASKVDYTEVAKNLKKMQQDCKASWDYLKIVAKHDGLANLMNSCGSSSSTQTASASSAPANASSDTGASSSPNSNNQPSLPPKAAGKLNNLSKLSMITTVMSGVDGSSSSTTSGEQPSGKQLKTRVSDFLTDCAERIMVLMVIHRRVMNRFQKLLVYLGCPSHQIKQTQPQQILKIINEFALEYRTKRERIREMLVKKQQCQHHHHHHPNRWQLNRLRWAGSQQCIDSLTGYSGAGHLLNRPCSTTSSCGSYANINSSSAATTCNDSMCNLSLAGDVLRLSHQATQQQQAHQGAHHHHHPRASSPSGYSQISNYSDYLFDQSCCNSRQQSVTPVPSNGNSRMKLEGKQFGQGHEVSIHKQNDEEQVRLKDEQLRRLLGAGKSIDGACSDLYQMSHWSSTMARVSRHPPPIGSKQRAASMDSGPGEAGVNAQQRNQSSYYKYLHNACGGQSMNDEEQNSDEEILQSLVRTATAKGNGSHHSHNSSASNANSSGGHRDQSMSFNTSNKSAKNKILSRFNCDRKSFRRNLRNGIEVSNVR